MSKQSEPKEQNQYQQAHSATHRLTLEELKRRNDYFETSNIRLKQFEHIASGYMRPYDKRGRGTD